MKYLAPIFFMLIPGNPLMAQYPIELKNTSFEDLPNASTVPVGWTPCGMSGETPPYIQPGFFGCELQPAEGRTHLGMVTHDNYTWESVSQQLPAPLDSGVYATW